MLSVPILAFAVFFLTQLVKPALKASILPQDKPWQNTALRGIVFLIAYSVVLLNTIALHRLDWSGAWGLLTAAGVVFAVAVASYHVLDDNPATPAPAATPPAAAAPTADASSQAPARTERGTFAKRQSGAPIAVSAPLQTSGPVVVRGANVDPSSAAPADPTAPTGT